MKHTAKHTKLIAYDGTDFFGPNGLWDEGETREEIQARNGKARLVFVALEDGADNAIDLASLDDDDFHDLLCQWRLAKLKSWTSPEADKAIAAERDARSNRK